MLNIVWLLGIMGVSRFLNEATGKTGDPFELPFVWTSLKQVPSEESQHPHVRASLVQDGFLHYPPEHEPPPPNTKTKREQRLTGTNTRQHGSFSLSELGFPTVAIHCAPQAATAAGEAANKANVEQNLARELLKTWGR